MIKWDGASGYHWARCTRCDRKLEQDETNITFVAAGNNVRTKGSVTCKICGATDTWDNTEV